MLNKDTNLCKEVEIWSDCSGLHICNYACVLINEYIDFVYMIYIFMGYRRSIVSEIPLWSVTQVACIVLLWKSAAIV